MLIESSDEENRMDSAIIGFLGLAGVVHLLLIVIPLGTTLKAAISVQSKLTWCAFLIFLPFIGAGLFHCRYRTSLFRGKPYEPSAHELGARSWSDSHDKRHDNQD